MNRRLIWIMALVLLACGAALWLGRGCLAERLFQAALDRNVGVDRSLALGDGLHAYVCGSGSPMPDADRAGPCIAVLAGRQGFVFDAGSGSARKLIRAGFPADRLQAVFLTHLHSDHFDGLGELLLQGWIGGGRNAPLPVYGPPGTEEVVSGLTTAYARDASYRVAHHGAAVARPDGFGARPERIALAADQPSRVIYDQDGVRITAIRVNHAPIAPAYGYRVDYKGRSLSISGDTVYSPEFVTASANVDLMFHEALNKHMVAAMGSRLRQRGRSDAARIMTDIQNYHASPEDAARAAQEAKAKALVFYHLVPPLPSTLIEPLFLGQSPQIYRGPLKIAQDGMIVSLPASGEPTRFSTGL